MTLGPPPALGVPSPKLQVYCSVPWSFEPGSVAWPLNCTRRPQSLVVSGPASTDGFTLSTVTVKLFVAESPVTSVTVS